MPTINQLVRKGRQTGVTKSTAPALQHGYNSMKKMTMRKDKRFKLLKIKKTIRKLGRNSKFFLDL